MKANEFMIGDWVLSKSDDKKYKINSIITQDDGTILLATEDGLHFDYMCEPIPLTAEILEKNGFEFNELPFIQGWEQFGLTLYLAANGYRINCGQNIALNVDNVHELQHALRLCGIEKEIEL